MNPKLLLKSHLFLKSYYKLQNNQRENNLLTFLQFSTSITVTKRKIKIKKYNNNFPHLIAKYPRALRESERKIRRGQARISTRYGNRGARIPSQLSALTSEWTRCQLVRNERQVSLLFSRRQTIERHKAWGGGGGNWRLQFPRDISALRAFSHRFASMHRN